MSGTAESSSSPSTKNDKPVIVRVKRKASQLPVDALWLEINERPLKRPLLDFDKLSISDSSSKVEELKIRKVFVRHVETVTTSEVTVDILQSFVSNSADALKSKGEDAEIRRTFKTENKQDQLLVKARQRQEILSKNARFEQIWRSRKEKKEFVQNEALHEMCCLYDVVRVDVDEKRNEVQADQFSELEDCRVMSQYLPLLREVLPSAAVEVEADIYDCMSKRAFPENYVYDYYAVKDDMDITDETAASPFPLVQVDDDDDDYYGGPDDSEYETDDSNAENYPLNEYPDEESSDNEEQDGSRCSDEESVADSRSSDDQLEEDESDSQGSFEPGELGGHDNTGFSHEDDIYDCADDGEDYDCDDFGDEVGGVCFSGL